MAPRGRPTRLNPGTTPPPVADPTTTTSVTSAQLQAMIDEGVTAVLAARATTRNGDDSHTSGTGVRRNERAVRECTYQDFMKCQPLFFRGTEGVVDLTQWFERMETVFRISNCTVENQVKFATCTLMGIALTWWNSHARTVTNEVAYAMTWSDLKKKMTTKYCPRNEIKKIEAEMWNLKVKGTDVVAYNQRFQELALLCDRMFPEETDKIERHMLPSRRLGDKSKIRATCKICYPIVKKFSPKYFRRGRVARSSTFQTKWNFTSSLYLVMHLVATAPSYRLAHQNEELPGDQLQELSTMGTFILDLVCHHPLELQFLFVKKERNGSLRMCIRFIGNAKQKQRIDLRVRLSPLRVREEDISKTALQTRIMEHYEFQAMRLVRIFRPFSKDIPSITIHFPRTAMDSPFYVLAIDLSIISAFVDSRLESIERFLNNFANQPNETNMNDLDSDDESVDTPLISPFPHSNNDSDDSEVLYELIEYENVGMLRREKEINSFDGDDLAFQCMIGFRKFVTYFDPFLPMNIITRKAYKTIMVIFDEKKLGRS
ncbi:reverse transcriptase domain-containing protein [Tanacetum coccineum]